MLFSISSAEFSATPLTYSQIGSSTDMSSVVVGNNTISQIRRICLNYYTDSANVDYISSFESLVSDLLSVNYKLILYDYSGYMYFSIVSDDVSVGFYDTYLYFTGINSSSSRTSYLVSQKSGAYVYAYSFSPSLTYCHCRLNDNPFKVTNVIYSNVSIKQLYSGYCWNGTDYYYEVSEGPEGPIILTDSELAAVIQSFYDSDLYKNQSNFTDFVVLYNYKNGAFSFIGTKNHLVQNIYYDGAHDDLTDFSSSDYVWWRFDNYLGVFENLVYPKFYVYDLEYGSTLSYGGEGLISELMQLKFDSEYSIIVYSNYDYDVHKFYPVIENNTIETILKETYTYDDTIDPTTTLYNPFESFVNPNITSPSLNIDSSEFIEYFDTYKSIFTDNSNSWLFVANNLLFTQFSSFIITCSILILIYRVTKGG